MLQSLVGWILAKARRRRRAPDLLGERTYGHELTIHQTEHLDVEIAPDGHVCAVWFRCQPVPFEEHRVGVERAAEMRWMVSQHPPPALLAVTLKED